MIHLTRHIGTELHGIQLTELTDQQKDELGLLIAERSVVFFRDQDISPQQQKELGEYFGAIEVHPQVSQVPGSPGVTVMWPDLFNKERGGASFRQPGGAASWHTDLVHEAQPAGVTHLHNDTVPELGGDTIWSSGWSCMTHKTFAAHPLTTASVQVTPHMTSFLRPFVASWMERKPYIALHMAILIARTRPLALNLSSVSIPLFGCIPQPDGRAYG